MKHSLVLILLLTSLGCEKPYVRSSNDQTFIRNVRSHYGWITVSAPNECGKAYEVEVIASEHTKYVRDTIFHDTLYRGEQMTKWVPGWRIYLVQSKNLQTGMRWGSVFTFDVPENWKYGDDLKIDAEIRCDR